MGLISFWAASGDGFDRVFDQDAQGDGFDQFFGQSGGDGMDQFFGQDCRGDGMDQFFGQTDNFEYTGETGEHLSNSDDVSSEEVSEDAIPKMILRRKKSATIRLKNRKIILT